MTDFKSPSDDQVRGAIRRIPNLPLRRAFFEGLRNPLWIQPLARMGAFSSPPEPEHTDDGYIRDTYWPAIDYLTRIAPVAPSQVVDVLLKLGASNNAWLRRGVFEIGATIPADQAARLQPLIKSWQATGFGWRTDPQDLIAFAVNLLEGGQTEVGKWFADIIFRPSKSKEKERPSLTLEDYWYEEGLPKVVTALGTDGLGLVVSWLEAYERREKRLTTNSDITYFTRDSIRHATDTLHDVEYALIDAVRGLATDAMIVDAAAATNVLLRSNMLLARKIALFSLSQALERAGDNKEQVNRLLGVADDLLADEASWHDSCRIDYAELARVVSRITGEPITCINLMMESGPRVDVERFGERVLNNSSDDPEVDQQVLDYVNHWKHLWLSAVGAGALSASLLSELAELDSQYGVIEEPLNPTPHFVGWTGPNSPLDQDEMLAMSSTELVAHLESWRPSGNRWGPDPTHEGQGRELAVLLTTNPMILVGANNLVERLRPTYIRAVLRGWEAAFKAGNELNWDQVADIVRDVLGHDDESCFLVEGNEYDDDASYRPAKDAAVSLLGLLAQRHDSPAIPEYAMAKFAEMLISLAADETAWNEYVSSREDGTIDALTISINWQWPIRVRGLIHLMSHGKEASWFYPARSALSAELERDDPHGASRAVLGEGIGRLIKVDPEWVYPRVPAWFGTEGQISTLQQIALTTAMAVHRYSASLYGLLCTPMIAAIESTEPVVSGWHTNTDPLQRIGEWVIEAIIRGDIVMSDPVADRFFSAAPAMVRGEAIGHIAWSFMHADVVDDEIRDRFASLWDERVALVRVHPEDCEELDKFFWFVRSGKFPMEWWLPRLKEAAELDLNLSTERYMIGKEIATAADHDPRGAFDALKVLLEGRNDADMPSYDLTRNAVPMVIARAITSGDDALAREATAYMNHLGEKGHLSLKAEVNEVIEGTIKQTDVDDDA